MKSIYFIFILFAISFGLKLKHSKTYKSFKEGSKYPGITATQPLPSNAITHVRLHTTTGSLGLIDNDALHFYAFQIAEMNTRPYL